MEKRFVYADNAATTAVSKPVLDAMMPYLTEYYGNPSSLYEIANEPKRAIEAAREQVAKGLGAEAREIYFTSCGSESDNWAIKMAALKNEKKGKHIAPVTGCLAGDCSSCGMESGTGKSNGAAVEAKKEETKDKE